MNRPLCRRTNGSGKFSLNTGTNEGSATAATPSPAIAAASPSLFRTARNATGASNIFDRKLYRLKLLPQRWRGTYAAGDAYPYGSCRAGVSWSRQLCGAIGSGASAGQFRQPGAQCGFPRSDGHPQSRRILLCLCDSDRAQWSLDQLAGRTIAGFGPLGLSRRCIANETIVGIEDPGFLGAARA